jgi:hypothetical protein
MLLSLGHGYKGPPLPEDPGHKKTGSLPRCTRKEESGRHGIIGDWIPKNSAL